MKKQLLTALLAFTTISCFATPEFIEFMDNIHPQPPSKLQLLRHLNYERFKLEKNLQAVSSYKEKELQQKLGKDYFAFMNIMNDLFELTQTTQEYSKLTKIALYITCRYMTSVGYPHDFFNVPEDTQDFILTKLQIKSLDQDKTYHSYIEEAFIQMLNTLLIKHCHQDDIKRLEDQLNSFLNYSTNDLISGEEMLYHCSSNPIYIMCNNICIMIEEKILTLVLQDIDSKIKELEQA